MPGTHYAFLDSALSVRQAELSVATEKLSVEQSKLETCLGGLFARATIDFSVFTPAMISISTICYIDFYNYV